MITPIVPGFIPAESRTSRPRFRRR